MRWLLCVLLVAACGDDAAHPDGGGGSGGSGGAGGSAGTGGSAGASGTGGAGGCRRTTGFVTDTNVHAEPAIPPLPPAGGTFVDPTFGTTILRATDSADCANCATAYSYWPTFNVDSTRFQVAADGGSGLLYQFDPATLTISGRQPLFSQAAPGGGTPYQEDAIWSALDPDVIYAHEGPRLWKYDVASHTYTMLKDFSSHFSGQYLWQMSRSLDDDVFAFARRDNTTYAYTGYFAWRRSTDSFLLDQSTSQLDEVQVDKDGRYLVIKTGMQGAGVIEVRVADLQTSTIFADLTDDGPDYAPGHSDNGHGVVIGADNWMNRVTFRQLATPHQLSTTLGFGNDWTQDYHLSFLADDESHITMSLYQSGAHNDGVFHNEIIQVATDGSQSVRRLAHHRAIVNAYEDSPRANISRDGCFVAFTSNWGGTGRRDVFIVSLR